MFDDLRYGLRMVFRTPGTSFVTIVTLAIAIGSTTAIFSVANVTLLRPLPFRDEAALVRLVDTRTRENGEISEVSFSQRNFHEVRARSRSFESIAAQMFANLNVTLGDSAERVTGIRVSDRWLETLGVAPARGRPFTPEEEALGRESRMALVSHGFWANRLGGDPAVVGRALRIDDELFQIVGVMPADFAYPYGAEIWMLWSFDPNDGRAHPLNVQARMKPGVTVAAARSELDAIAAELGETFPDTNKGWGMRPNPLRESLVEGHTKVVAALGVCAAFVVIISCVNVVALLLARSVERRREFSVRAALGASPWRQARLCVFENVALSVLGGAAGIAATFPLRDALVTLLPPRFTDLVTEAPVDPIVLAAAFLLAISTGVIIGLVPAIRAAAADPGESLASSGGRSSSARRSRLLETLVVAEIALTLALLGGAASMLDFMRSLASADLGFEPEGLATFAVSFPEIRYRDAAGVRAVAAELAEKLGTAPGVMSVAATDYFPLKTDNRVATIALDGLPPSPNLQIVANHRLVTPGFFETIGARLEAGRTFDVRDSASAEPVVIVSRSFAERHWAGLDPIGRAVRVVTPAGDRPWMRVAGVVRDLANPGLSGNVHETIWLPLDQGLAVDSGYASRRLIFAARTNGNPAAIVPGLRSIVRGVDANLPVFDVNLATDLHANTYADKRTGAYLLSALAIFGVAMAAVGTYGVMSYQTRRRSLEFAIRSAVGARPSQLLSLAVRKGVLLLAAGLASGAVLAFGVSQLLASATFGVPAAAATTYAAVAATLVVTVALACFIPARRALGTDPSEVLNAHS